ncbi:unnamed protein product [Protopolystoma xenopodis]|uniref:Uncharacterized protein n=1 Tax=Protopolystoma xenopodis TaxID=117903 RepID=A0A448XRY8_9PLAT|nr:unnamed protein product [Protopolystoma xenopodis]
MLAASEAVDRLFHSITVVVVTAESSIFMEHSKTTSNQGLILIPCKPLKRWIPTELTPTEAILPQSALAPDNEQKPN